MYLWALHLLLLVLFYLGLVIAVSPFLCCYGYEFINRCKSNNCFKFAQELEEQRQLELMERELRITRENIQPTILNLGLDDVDNQHNN